MIKRNISSEARRANYFTKDTDGQRTVQVVIEFSKIGEIDTMNEKYHAEVFIESKWIDHEEIVEYSDKKYWNPKLFIENAMQISKEDIKYEIHKDENLNTVITEYRQVKGIFWERLELENFPIDVQELSIVLSSKLNSNEIKIISDPQRISYINFEAGNTFTDQQKWRLFKLVKVSETASYDTNSTSSLNDQVSVIDYFDYSPQRNHFKHPKLVASCFCSRKPGYYVFNAYFLIFLITISSLTIFAIDPKLPQNRLQTTYTLLLTSVSFKWVINRSLPTISYLTSLDKYAIVCIFYVCLLCVWHSLVGAFWPNNQSLDQWLLIAFSIIFFIIHLIFLIWIYFAYGEIRRLTKQEKEFIKLFKKIQVKDDTITLNNFIARL